MPVGHQTGSCYFYVCNKNRHVKNSKVIHVNILMCIYVLRPVGHQAGRCYFQQMSFIFTGFLKEVNYCYLRESHLLKSQLLLLNK